MIKGDLFSETVSHHYVIPKVKINIHNMKEKHFHQRTKKKKISGIFSDTSDLSLRVEVFLVVPVTSHSGFSLSEVTEITERWNHYQAGSGSVLILRFTQHGHLFLLQRCYVCPACQGPTGLVNLIASSHFFCAVVPSASSPQIYTNSIS